MTVNVSLTFEEGLSAGLKGLVQQMRAVKTGRVGHDHGATSSRTMSERYAQTIMGQMGEEALCKYFKIYPAAGVERITDVDPGGFEIRTTHHHNGHLLIYKNDIPKKLETKFVLVCGHWPDFQLIGWILGKDGAQEPYWRPEGKQACWWIPQNKLRPMSEINA